MTVISFELNHHFSLQSERKLYIRKITEINSGFLQWKE